MAVGRHLVVLVYIACSCRSQYLLALFHLLLQLVYNLVGYALVGTVDKYYTRVLDVAVRIKLNTLEVHKV